MNSLPLAASLAVLVRRSQSKRSSSKSSIFPISTASLLTLSVLSLGLRLSLDQLLTSHDLILPSLLSVCLTSTHSPDIQLHFCGRPTLLLLINHLSLLSVFDLFSPVSKFPVPFASFCREFSHYDSGTAGKIDWRRSSDTRSGHPEKCQYSAQESPETCCSKAQTPREASTSRVD